MRIDVVLPTYNRCGLLAKAIGSFLAADVPGGVEARLVVVDNNSKDDTRGVVDAYIGREPGRVVYLFESKQGRHHALNTGISFSFADVIAFFDDDEILGEHWIAVIARNFGDETVDYIGGEMRPDWQARAPDWFPPGYGGVLGIVQNGSQRRRYGSSGFTGMLTGGNNAIRRDVLQRCGPYSAEFMYAEDRYMHGQLDRIGAVGFYDPDLIVLHHIPAERLTKAYYRHWAFTEGRTHGKLALKELEATKASSFLGAPPWMWGRALNSALDIALRRFGSTPGKRFRAELQLIEFWGYLTARTLRLSDRYRDRTAFR